MEFDHLTSRYITLHRRKKQFQNSSIYINMWNKHFDWLKNRLHGQFCIHSFYFLKMNFANNISIHVMLQLNLFKCYFYTYYLCLIDVCRNFTQHTLYFNGLSYSLRKLNCSISQWILSVSIIKLFKSVY